MKYVQRAIKSDLEYVAAHMRPEDIEECKAGGLDPLPALIKGFELGDTYALCDPVAGYPVAILGVCPGKMGGIIWMLGTPEIEKYTMTFLKNSKPVLDVLFAGYKVLGNYSYYKNEVHHKWLRWLGFTLDERQGDWIPFFKWKE